MPQNDLADKKHAKTRKGPVMYQLLCSELLIECFPNLEISYVRTFASVAQNLRDIGTFNLKLTIVAVIGQKEYCEQMNKFWNASKTSPTSVPADLHLKLEFHSLWYIVF
ncbi:hypothetical protein Zmor_011055 [Zophobas morio]|uniref:Uncharacterized protein n=1 Tax=Zophobas morio TaxID=2755281 RepID=A0AA38IPJ8_9CUCU|nr:hypothetical protein Zmor_011055 [Zophobas morio]